MQIPHSRSIIVGQKNSTNDQKSLPRADLWSQIPLCPASPPPPYPSDLTLIGALCVRNDRTKTSNRTPQLQIGIKGKEALRQIITSYLHTNLCLQPVYSPVNRVQLCFHCSRLFHGLLPHILTCLHEVCEIEPITLRRRHRLSAYPLIQPDYNLDIFFWALWFACKGKTWGISHIACKISSALSVLYLWYEGKFSKTKIIRFLPGLQRIFVCSLYQLSLRLLKTYPSTIINIFEHRIDSRQIVHFFFFEFFPIAGQKYSSLVSKESSRVQLSTEPRFETICIPECIKSRDFMQK